MRLTLISRSKQTKKSTMKRIKRQMSRKKMTPKVSTMRRWEPLLTRSPRACRMSLYISRDMGCRWTDKGILNSKIKDTTKLITRGWGSLSILGRIIISLCRRNRSIVAMCLLSNSTREYSLYNSLLLARQTLASLVKVL